KIVVCNTTSEYNARKGMSGIKNPLLERVGRGIDHVYALVGAVGQVILGALRIDKADVEPSQRIARYRDRCQASSFRVGRCPGASAGSRGGVTGGCKRYKADQDWGEQTGRKRE